MKDSAAISYDQQTVDAPNPLARFSHRTRARRSVALTKQYLPTNGTVVDFGAGTCRQLLSLAEERPDANLIALEPYMEHIHDSRVAYIDRLSTLHETIDVVTAFETCEHLSDDDLRTFLTDAHAALTEGGTLIISVPIMIGTALLPKELSRIASFGGRSDYSLAELVRGICALSVARAPDRGTSHKGFDFRCLRRKIAEVFVVERELLSPVPLPWWINSQIFFVCRKKRETGRG